jgi:hypothetical protein
MSIIDQHYALSYITPLFDTQAPTCFGIHVPFLLTLLSVSSCFQFHIVLVVFAFNSVMAETRLNNAIIEIKIFICSGTVPVGYSEMLY